MKNADHSTTFVVQRDAREVFEAICRVREWWTVNMDGASRAVGDEFTVQFGDVHLTRQRVVEFVEGKRLTWEVTESHLPWLRDPQEWKGTRIIFGIDPVNEGARLTFTHRGLTPAVECFSQCEKGWEYFIGTSLLNLINTGIGQPDTTERTHMDIIGHVSPTNA